MLEKLESKKLLKKFSLKKASEHRQTKLLHYAIKHAQRRIDLGENLSASLIDLKNELQTELLPT